MSDNAMEIHTEPIERDAQAIIDAAIQSAAPTALDDDNVRFYHATVPAGGGSVVIDLDRLREQSGLNYTPNRKVGRYVVYDADSFVAYLFKHGDADSEVWADTINTKITAVLNAHHSSADEPSSRWEDHKVEYAARVTDEWQAWMARDNKLGSQADFAEHIEDRLTDIADPTAADMLELAQMFQATIGVNVESSKRLSSGQREFEYRETIDAKAGHAGRLDVPERFTLVLRPFEGSDAFRIVARLRYRLVNGTLTIGYKLDRPQDIMREAFLSVVGNIQSQITESEFDVPVLLGSGVSGRG